MRLTWRLGVNLATVLLLGIVSVGWVVSNIIGNGVLNPPFEVVADFAHSGGVFTNQEVTYRGVVIGSVGELELNSDGVDVSLLIDEEWKGEIPADVTARVQSKSAVGEQFVNLIPISEAGGTLGEGDRIARENTELPVDFQALLKSLDTVLADIPPDRVNRVVTNLADGIGGRGEEIASILTSLRELSVAFADVAPEQQRLLENATTAGSEFLRTKDEFAAAMQASDDVLEGLGDEPEELAAFFRANDRIAREGIALLAKHGDNLHEGIRGLADFVEFQNENRASVIQSLEHIPEFLHAIEESSIPWVAPDGRRFYRIRVGLVFANVRSSWPCKYETPAEYERFPHVRDARRVSTNTRCRPPDEETSGIRLRALLKELRAFARANRREINNAVRPAAVVGLQVGIPDAVAELFAPAVPSPTPSGSPSATLQTEPSVTPEAPPAIRR
jgi:phospholipid/cholesterol/gamma-HCH transport system substrate-binding protein